MAVDCTELHIESVRLPSGSRTGEPVFFTRPKIRELGWSGNPYLLHEMAIRVTAQNVAMDDEIHVSINDPSGAAIFDTADTRYVGRPLNSLVSDGRISAAVLLRYGEAEVMIECQGEYQIRLRVNKVEVPPLRPQAGRLRVSSAAKM